MKRGWWYSATTEQKLAQVDAGIALGMTAAQVAMNCGCAYENHANRGALVLKFAGKHGRRFSAEMLPKHHESFIRGALLASWRRYREQYDNLREEFQPQAPQPDVVDLVSGLQDWGWQ